MKEIRQPENYLYAFDAKQEAIAVVENGEEICVFTRDAFGGRLDRQGLLPSDLSGNLNPVTGPLYIRDALPGDSLKIEIIDIDPLTDWGVSVVARDFGALVPTGSTAMLTPPLKEKTWFYRREKDGSYRNSERLKVNWSPFIGTIATSCVPESVSSLTPGPMGGNMDVPDVCPGNTLYLPVYTPGAQLYVGDCHAAQGDGEICGAALEISARVTLRISVRKGKTIGWPRIENHQEIMVVGSARPMEDAARIAYAQLIKWITQEYGWDMMDAYQLLSLCGKMTVGNMVDPLYSMVAKIEKKYL